MADGRVGCCPVPVGDFEVDGMDDAILDRAAQGGSSGNQRTATPADFELPRILAHEFNGARFQFELSSGLEVEVAANAVMCVFPHGWYGNADVAIMLDEFLGGNGRRSGFCVNAWQRSGVGPRKGSRLLAKGTTHQQGSGDK